jgi:hypothetical protein
MGIESGPGPAEVQVDPVFFLEQHGLSDFADMRIEAHGGFYSVTEAMAECPPFAKMIKGMAIGMERLDAETKREIIGETIQSMASEATQELPADAKKKF